MKQLILTACSSLPRLVSSELFYTALIQSFLFSTEVEVILEYKSKSVNEKMDYKAKYTVSTLVKKGKKKENCLEK